MTVTLTSALKKLMLLFLIFWGLYIAKPFLMPIFFGGVIATLFLPFCKWMEFKKIPKGVATFVCLFILLIIISLLIYLLGWQISSFAGDFDLLKQKAIEKATYIQQYIFDHLGVAIEKQTQIIKTEQPSFTSIMQLVFGSVRYLFINFILILA